MDVMCMCVCVYITVTWYQCLPGGGDGCDAEEEVLRLGRIAEAEGAHPAIIHTETGGG